MGQSPCNRKFWPCIRGNHSNDYAIANSDKVTILTVKTIDEQAGRMCVVLRDLVHENAMV